MSGLGQPGFPAEMGGGQGLPQNIPDPESLPPGHPMRVMAEKMGLAGPGAGQGNTPGLQGSPVGPPNAPTSPMGPGPFPGAPAASQAAMRPAPMPQRVTPPQVPGPPANDPMARPFKIPSTGLPYGTDGIVLISPMRGEQQEIMAGAGDGLAASPAFRQLVRACTNCNGIVFQDLLMEDFQSIMLHVMAFGIGDDLIPMAPTCDKCGCQFDGSMRLGEWPARVIQRATAGEEATWPPETTEAEDDEARILREMGLDGDDNATKSPQTIYTASTWDESWPVTLSNGQKLRLRYLRVRDWEMAEDFAERSGSTGVHPAAALGRFLRARAIAEMDGKRPGMLPLMAWCKQSPLALLREMDEYYSKRSFGFTLDPLFRCPRCSHRFRQQLPLSGEMLRRHSTFG